MNFAGSVENLPDAFIYVVREGKTLSFLRFPAAQYRSNPAYRNFDMSVERGQNPKGAYFEAGTINMRICINSENDWNNLKRLPPPGQPSDGREKLVSWGEEPRNLEPTKKKMAILANIYMGKNLISSDPDGMCDPLLVFDHHGAQSKSSVYKNSLNPVWNERVLINTYRYDDYFPPLVLKVFDLDENLITSNNYECLGYSTVEISETDIVRSGDANTIPEMKWYTVRDESNTSNALILMSLTVLQLDRPLDLQSIRPLAFPRDSYKVKIHILGLRDLQSNGLFQVKNPYIKFHVGALRNGDKSKGGSLFDVLTARCTKGGPNASFSELVTFDADLPVNVTMLPSLTCLVFDTTTFNLTNSMLGVFNIEISSAYTETLFFLVEKLKALLDIVQKDPLKAKSSVGIIKILDEYQKELEMYLPLINSDQFKKRAFKNSTVTDAANVDLKSLVGSNTNVHSSNLQASNLGVAKQDSEFQADPVVIYPRYATDSAGKEDIRNEVKPPSLDKYQRLGYDTLKKKTKQYRLLVNRPLENTDYIMSSVFTTIPVTRGKQLQTDKSFWDRLFSKRHHFKTVGKYKGAVAVYREKLLTDLQNLNIREELQRVDLPTDNEKWKMSQVDKDIMNEVDVRVRLYIVEADITGTYDIGSDPDIYTKIYLGEKLLFDNKDKRINDRKNPKFFSSHEFKAVFPGASTLKIDFVDYDPIGSDEVVGSTWIDLEDRFFDKKWRNDIEHPIEKRDIKKSALASSRGTVKLWVEIDRLDESERIKRPLQDISPIPDQNFEFRVIIWEANDVPITDPEGLGDIFVRVTFPSLSSY